MKRDITQSNLPVGTPSRLADLAFALRDAAVLVGFKPMLSEACQSRWRLALRFELPSVVGLHVQQVILDWVALGDPCRVRRFVVAGGSWKYGRWVDVSGKTDARKARKVAAALRRDSEQAAFDERQFEAQKRRNADCQARLLADFVDAEGKALVPLSFVQSNGNAGQYTLNPKASSGLQSPNWTRDEVLKLVAVLREIRQSMVLGGRLR